jgi:hypothetical protein
MVHTQDHNLVCRLCLDFKRKSATFRDISAVKTQLLNIHINISSCKTASQSICSRCRCALAPNVAPATRSVAAELFTYTNIYWARLEALSLCQCPVCDVIAKHCIRHVGRLPTPLSFQDQLRFWKIKATSAITDGELLMNVCMGQCRWFSLCLIVPLYA